MDTSLVDFLLIGGGLASVTAAETLRIGGADGRVAILCAENTLPYHRPPLSKGFLLDSPSRAGILIRDPAFYRDHRIEVLLGARALRLDPASSTVDTDTAGRFHFGKLLIATGASLDKLSVQGAHLQGIHYLRTVDDALALQQAMPNAEHAAVIGASFIGMEMAAAFATRGIKTTLIARDELLYEKLNSPEVAQFFAEYFRARSVEFIFGEAVVEFRGATKVEGVVTSTGRLVPCDIAGIGIGVHPATGFLRDSDLCLDEGVVVDQYLETNRPGIFAAGDVANFYDPIARVRHRAEHWDNAVRQGRIAAWNMLGERQSWRTVSYIFSDVFDLTFNVVGTTPAADERIVRGAVEDGAFSVLYLTDNRLRGAFLLEQSLVEAKAAGALIINRSDLAKAKAQLADSRCPLDRTAVQTVLILQGGGALGAFECGVVKALEEQKIHPDLVAGVSIGAFNAAIIAANPRNATAALEAFWRELSMKTLDAPNEELRRTISSLQSLVFGAPNFFRPRWFEPVLGPAQLPAYWTSFYDPTPLKATLKQNTSPLRV